MVEETFSINTAWGIEPPCYVRKVDRSGHCRDATTIRDKVFCPEPDDNAVSVFAVASATDLARVAIALNANRKGGSLTEPLFLIAVAPDELAGIVLRRAPGATLCKWANHLHHNLLVTAPSQVASLAEALVRAGRKHRKFTEKAMREALEATTNDGCRAADPSSTSCACDHGLSTSRLPWWLGWLGLLLDWMRARLTAASNRLPGVRSFDPNRS
jgi:hypothetical protein